MKFTYYKEKMLLLCVFKKNILKTAFTSVVYYLKEYSIVLPWISFGHAKNSNGKYDYPLDGQLA